MVSVGLLGNAEKIKRPRLTQPTRILSGLQSVIYCPPRFLCRKQGTGWRFKVPGIRLLTVRSKQVEKGDCPADRRDAY